MAETMTNATIEVYQMSRQDDLEQLLHIRSRYLQKLKETQARKGVNAPADLLLEIEDLEAEIEPLQKELEALENTPEPKLAPTSPFPLNGKTNWGKIAAIAGVAAAIIAVIALIISSDFRGLFTAAPTPQPPSENFSYQVRVEAKDSGKFILNAKVTIEVGGKAPLDGFTDSSGLAVIFIGASHAGQPGRLIVEADGYQRHTQNIDLTPDTLPDVIQLESE